MKAMYIILFLLLTTAAFAAWGIYFTDRQETAVSIPEKKNSKEQIKKKTDWLPAVKRDNELNLEQLSGSNIFEPNRGEGDAIKDGNPVTGRVRIENIYSLTGICNIDKENGAIIIARNQPPVSPVSESGGKGKAKIRHFYKIGDTLDGGYVLSAIAPNGVTLKKGSDEQKLTLHFYKIGDNPWGKTKQKPDYFVK
jgi:hypothetical protein